MRMAVVLPQLFLELYFHNFRQVFRTDFPDVDVEYIFYIDYKEAPALLKDRQQRFNAVIFAGGNAFYYIYMNIFAYAAVNTIGTRHRLAASSPAYFP